MRHSHGEVTILLDTSLEPTGDFVAPLLAAFDDPAVGIAGGWGVTSGDARQFTEAPPGPVDAIEAYCLAHPPRGAARGRRLRPPLPLLPQRRPRPLVRRARRRLDGGADRPAAAALATSTAAGPSLPDEERDRLSKRNFYRFLDRWGSRPDLLLHPDPDR